jgi:hypothetical protein
MHRSIAIAAALVLGLAGASLHADDRGTGTTGRPGAPGMRSPAGDGPDMEHGSQPLTATTGVVRNIDRQDGDVTLESQGRQMEIELPPTALGDLQTGDQVAVGIRKVGKAEPGMEPGDTPASTTRGTDRAEMRGVVREVDRDDGEVTVESKGTKYDLTFAPTALRDIQQGDQVAITVHKTGSHGSTQHGDAPPTR